MNPRLFSLLRIITFAMFLAVPAAGQPPHTKFASAVAYGSGGPYSYSVAVADLRSNGQLDLVVTNYCQIGGQDSCQGTGEVAVLLGNGDGTFQPAVVYSTGAYFATFVAVGDLNSDGIPDLVVADQCVSYVQNECTGSGVSVLLGNGDGTFQSAVTYGSGGYPAYSVAVGDLRGNGILDLVVTNAGFECDDPSVGVLLGNGDGTFQPAVTYDTGGSCAASVAVGDVNGDGIPDLIVANYCYDNCGYPNGLVGVLLGNGDGTFQPAVTYDSGGEFADSVALGDLRGNGIVDVVVANEWADGTGGWKHGEVGVLLGNGDGAFQPAVSYAAHGNGGTGSSDVEPGIGSLAVADVNGDGIPDVVVVEPCDVVKDHVYCVSSGEVNVFLGNGDGTFQSPITYGSGGAPASALAIADLNGDGRPDLAVANMCSTSCSNPEGIAGVLLNETYYASKTVLASSPNPSQVNQTVTFTATITPGVSNGEVVTFYNGKTEIGTGTTTNGVATLSTSFSSAGKFTIKASYPGDAFRKPSSGSVKQVVTQ